MLSRLITSVLILALSNSLIAQLLDDSTELVYGPATVRIIYENDLLENRESLTELDTSLTNLEASNNIPGRLNSFQHLGNIGTALFPIFYDAPIQIGVKSGYNAYDLYYPKPSDRKYYDTKSPFMELMVTLGGLGRSMVDFSYSQNINPNWNFGVNISKYNIDKQIGAEQTEGDRNVERTSGDIYTYYYHPDKPYKLMASLSSTSHKLDETGGILVAEDASDAARFQYQDSNIKLEDARNEETRTSLHIYQEYGFFDQFQLYHELDRNTQSNFFNDNADNNALTYDEFYLQFLLDSDSSYQQSDFSSFSNQIGLKGSLGNIYYRFYLKNRIVDQDYLYNDPFKRTIENYIGGLTKFTWKDIFQIQADAELLQTGEFKLNGKLESDLINVGYNATRYKQTNLVQQYFGNHHEWENNFSQGFNNNLWGEVKLNLGKMEVRPSINLNTLDNLVYFDTLIRPNIISDPIVMSQIGTEINLSFGGKKEHNKGFRFENEVLYTLVSGNDKDLIRIPSLFYNGKFYWEGMLFNKTAPVQIGTNIHARTAYFAHNYTPSIQQYFLQDSDELPGFVTADVFASMQVSKIFLYLKVVYANMLPESGYFVTPLYPGQRRVLDLGVRWLFFD